MMVITGSYPKIICCSWLSLHPHPVRPDYIGTQGRLYPLPLGRRNNGVREFRHVGTPTPRNSGGGRFHGPRRPGWQQGFSGIF